MPKPESTGRQQEAVADPGDWANGAAGKKWRKTKLTLFKISCKKNQGFKIIIFGMNFFFHPYSGGAYFNSARANGYGYFASVPFAFLGSLMWEYFGETTLPAYNDIINTTLSGALFGEILYRLSSQILDDRTTGMERFYRELAAAIISPGRAFGGLLQKKLTRVTTKEIYQ